MEVVAAVSSVAGIASLVGQSLIGLSSLYSFFIDCREASKTANQFLRALTSLEGTIKDVETLINSIKHISDNSTESNLASLTIHVEDCKKDIDRWLEEAQSCLPGHGPATKSVFKKFLVAVKKQSIKDVFQDMAAHKESISLSLSTTGRLLDVQHLKKADVLHGKVDEVAQYGKVTAEALGRLENRFQHSESDEFELRTSRSLGSIASQLTRIESLLLGGSGTRSSTRPPRHRRTGSTTSLHATRSASPAMRSKTRRLSEPLPARADDWIFSIGQLEQMPSVSPKDQQRDEALSGNESDGQITCQYCENVLGTEAGMSFHAGCMHKYDKSWSCTLLTDYKSAFSKATEGFPQWDAICGFCGIGFPLIVGYTVISKLEHVKAVHHFGECDPPKTFTGKGLFRLHLINAHAAKIGPWTEKLDNACSYQVLTSPPILKSTLKRNHTLTPPSPDFHDPDGDHREIMNDSGSLKLVGETKTIEGLAALELFYGDLNFFDAFEGLIAHAGESLSRSLAEYIRYHQLVEIFQAQNRIISALTPHFNLSESSTVNLKLREVQERNRVRIRTAENWENIFWSKCWRAGYDLDEIDQAMKTTLPHDTISYVPFLDRRPEPVDEQQQPEQQHKGWWDVLHHIGSQNWVSKKDRINSWLLQNLAAQPSEALHHRRYLQDEGVAGDQLSDEEWARLVLKFWTLDDAARPSESVDCSTNGAVDSDGACHSARVKLSETLPLPIRKREREGEKEKSLDSIERDIDSDSEPELIEIALEPPKKRRRDEKQLPPGTI